MKIFLLSILVLFAGFLMIGGGWLAWEIWKSPIVDKEEDL